MKKAKINLKFKGKLSQEDKNFYKNSLNSTIKKLNKLFVNHPEIINLSIFDNRSDFLNAINKPKAPNWLIAYIPQNSKSNIYIAHNKKSLGRKELKQIITHELTHLYTNLLNAKLPDWIKEGLSVYVAKQIYYPKISINDWKKINKNHEPFKKISWKMAVKYNGYHTAGLLIMFLVNQYGWKKFIKSLTTHKCNVSIFKTIINKSSKKDSKMLIEDFEDNFVK